MKQIITGAIILAFAVALGAFGAHALKLIIDEDALKIFETGVRYQFYHGFGIILCGVLNVIYKTPAFRMSAIFFIIGILLFSGSLYILSFKEYFATIKYIGMITPLGGVCFIAGWLMMAYKGYKAVSKIV